ncbi:uncharacterized protein LOC110383982 isoform X1 [Helicoverpa armigera]|uniref:uncharacterized protein LOC110383982 isoform X1 n=1 Tax=Helicoverpa armigera TaxID=29058 RepID=UPI003082DDD7
MAWTLHLLLGIAIISASAYKCKHALQANAQLPLTRTQNGTKVVNLQSRTGESNDQIVFPGLTSGDIELEIPDHCKKIGICDDVPNYPTEEVEKIIAETPELTKETDNLDLPDVPDIAQRVGPMEDNIELCNIQEKVVYPKAAVDASGNWHVVLNKEEDPIQGFRVEICDTDGDPCLGFAYFAKGYEARCKQKYVYRNMHVLSNGGKVEKKLKVPSCCACVARQVLT